MAGISVDWKKDVNERFVEGKMLVFHCHHYNCHLQKTIEDSRIVDGKGIQINVAREVSFEHFAQAFAAHGELTSPEQKFAFASDFFRTAGFGLVDFSGVNESGGMVRCPKSHYALGWVSKFGKRSQPVCFFNTGWIAGLIAAVYAKERYHYEVSEIQCEAVTGKGCTYHVEVR